MTTGLVLLAQNGTTTLDDPGDAWTLVRTAFVDLAENIIAQSPLVIVALLVFLLGLLFVRVALRTTQRGLRRSRFDATLEKLTLTFVRLALLLFVTLIALAVAGIEVGAVLGAMGLLGLAFAFAFQHILENFIAGLLILMRKPFRIGDQVISDGHEGTVIDVNLRITKVLGYDGTTMLLPNADVFRNALTNLTEQGKRRTSITIGIDYRDDHETAGEIIRAAVQQVDGVLSDPEAEVLLSGLGSSSVDFEVRFWSLPDIGSVRRTQDRVLKAAKTAVEAAGMTIPWPIRTLEPGAALRIRTVAEPAPARD